MSYGKDKNAMCEDCLREVSGVQWLLSDLVMIEADERPYITTGLNAPNDYMLIIEALEFGSRNVSVCLYLNTLQSTICTT